MFHFSLTFVSFRISDFFFHSRTVRRIQRRCVGLGHFALQENVLANKVVFAMSFNAVKVFFVDVPLNSWKREEI